MKLIDAPFSRAFWYCVVALCVIAASVAGVGALVEWLQVQVAP